MCTCSTEHERLKGEGGVRDLLQLVSLILESDLQLIDLSSP
jgi:hypothetical protein